MKKIIKYNLQIIQETRKDFENIEGPETIQIIHNNDITVTPDGKKIKQKSYRNRNIMAYKDICAEYNTETSMKSLTVPSIEPNYYIVKEVSSYKFLKDKPREDYSSSLRQLMQAFGKSFNKASLGAEFIKDMKIAKKLDSSESYYNSRVYSFSEGGIEKASSVFYLVDSNNTLQPLPENTLIDYLEGFIYLPPEVDARLVCGVYNIKPVIVEGFRPLDINETKTGYYKIDNRVNKTDIEISYINSNTALFSSPSNLYIEVEGASVKLDGIPIHKDQKYFIPKNSKFILEKSEENTIDTNYTSNNDIIYDQIEKFEDILNSALIDRRKEDKVRVEKKEEYKILLYREISTGVYSESPVDVLVF